MELATVDTTSEAFGARLAAILRAARHDQERSLRVMAWRSRGAFSLSALRDLESGRAELVGLDLASLASLYRIDLAALLQERVPLVVDVPAGTIGTGGVVRAFDTTHQDGLLLAYLHLVRDLRDLQEARSIALRREDVEVLASGLRADAAVVLDRLGQLMGATVTQRRSAVAMFAAGAALIVLSTGAVALESGLHQPSDGDKAALVAAVVTPAASDDLGGRIELGGGDDPFEAPVSALGVPEPAPAPLMVSTVGPDAASGAGGTGSESPQAAPVIDVTPPDALGVSSTAPIEADEGEPAVGAPIVGGPVGAWPVLDVPRATPWIPEEPAGLEVAPETPGPRVPAPVAAPPVQPQPEPDAPSSADETPAEDPSDEVPVDPSPVDGAPVGGPAGDTTDDSELTDDPTSELPTVDVGADPDVPASGEDPEGGDTTDAGTGSDDLVDAGPGSSDPDDADPGDANHAAAGPDADPDGTDTGGADAADGATPGNSPAAGNTTNVGTPGNSGNENAGGGASVDGPPAGPPTVDVPVRGTRR